MQNATGGVIQQIPTGIGKSKVIAKDNSDREIIDSVFKPKVYGKKGRRQRAYERLQKQYNIQKSVLVEYEKILTAYEKKVKSSRVTGEEYERVLYSAAGISNGLPKMEQELATLKSRI